jgi:hypothetical protein
MAIAEFYNLMAERKLNIEPGERVKLGRDTVPRHSDLRLEK